MKQVRVIAVQSPLRHTDYQLIWKDSEEPCRVGLFEKEGFARTYAATRKWEVVDMKRLLPIV